MEQELNWYDGEEPQIPDSLSVDQLEELCNKIAEQRKVCDEISSKHKEENQKLDGYERTLLAALETIGKDSYKANAGTFSVNHRTSVRVPQGDDKFAFFEYLKERGMYDSLVTVNSQTLNGFYKQEFENAKQQGRLMEFKIPGIGEPNITKLISFRKAAK